MRLAIGWAKEVRELRQEVHESADDAWKACKGRFEDSFSSTLDIELPVAPRPLRARDCAQRTCEEFIWEGAAGVGRPASSRGHHSPAHGLPQRRNDSRRMCMCMCVACCLKSLVPSCTIPTCKVVVCWHLEQDFCSCRYHPPCFQDAHRLQNMSGFDGVRRDSLLPEEGYMEVMEASWSHTRPGL